MVNILIACTGSVATIKITILIDKILQKFNNPQLSLVVTENSLHFFNPDDIPKSVRVYRDHDEWDSWKGRGDPVLHIELGKWADILLIAPLDANTLAKIANGLCDNLLTNTVRAWETSKPLVFCPAMNTKMYEHPLTQVQVDKLVGWGYKLVPVVRKTLICGDTGLGAMAEVDTIVDFLENLLRGKF